MKDFKFYLVEIPADEDSGWVSDEVTFANGRMRQVNQRVLLAQLLADADLRSLAVQIFNDPDNPEWQKL